MASVASGAGLVYLGMDTSINEIVVAVLGPGEDAPAVVERIFNDEASVRRLVGRFPDRGLLRACYEAGPGGYELHRLLTSMGVACEVVAPALVPREPGRRVKTDRRDSLRLALSLRAGQLTAVRVPSPAEEAVRDLVRARADAVDDRRRTQQRLTALLSRHGRVWRNTKWTAAHLDWAAKQVFDEPALNRALAGCLAGLAAREAELGAWDAELARWAQAEPWAEPVRRLGAYRGIAALTGLTLAAEVLDWRRFPTARAFMSFAGLTPAEYSSGQRTRRGHITKAGPQAVRTALVEAAWAYRHRPAIGAGLKRRQAGAAPATLARSWAAQHRVHATYRKLAARGKPAGTAAVAAGRELAGFVWAEMTDQPAR